MLLIGVDPGTSGAIAFRELGSDEVRVVDMPKVVSSKRKMGADGESHMRTRSSVDLFALAVMLDAAAKDTPVLAVLEQVGVMPHDGGVQAFGFGASYGGVKGVMAGLFLRVLEVRPAKWKKLLEVPADKDMARARASALFPRGSAQWPLKKHDGRAEAALLTLYGERWLNKGDTHGEGYT